LNTISTIRLNFFLVMFFIFGCSERITNPIDNNNNKHPLKGLVTMGSVADLRSGNFNVLKEANIHPDIYSGVVIRTTWGELEPQQGQFNFSSIRNALHDIEIYNNAHPNYKLGAKLRISTTINPPDWILNLANGPVEIVINESLSYNIGLFWTEEYHQAWRRLQFKLAEVFDNDKLLQEVCITSPAMATDEPFVTIFNQATIKNLHQKGFTDNAFKQALKTAIDDYTCWEKTFIDFSFNTYREIDSGIPVKNIDFTIEVIKEFKNKYEERAVLSNHGLQEELSIGALPIYKTFYELGGAVAAQTKAPDDLTEQTFKVGLQYGVSEFEIWDSRNAGGYANFDINDLKYWESIINN